MTVEELFEEKGTDDEVYGFDRILASYEKVYLDNDKVEFEIILGGHTFRKIEDYYSMDRVRIKGFYLMDGEIVDKDAELESLLGLI